MRLLRKAGLVVLCGYSRTLSTARTCRTKRGGFVEKFDATCAPIAAQSPDPWSAQTTSGPPQKTPDQRQKEGQPPPPANQYYLHPQGRRGHERRRPKPEWAAEGEG